MSIHLNKSPARRLTSAWLATLWVRLGRANDKDPLALRIAVSKGGPGRWLDRK